jgi:AcrR family transcriptional regulator
LPGAKRHSDSNLASWRPSYPGLVIARPSGSVGGTRADQRSRLLEAIVTLVATAGYAQTRVGDLASAAGVSRATFYDQFKSKEDCFLAAHDELSTRLLAATASAINGKSAKHATRSIVGALTEFAAGQTHEFSFLTYEAIVAGPGALDRRERLIGALAGQLEQALGAEGGAAPLEVPAWILLGGLIRVLGMRVRRDEPLSRVLPAELTAWVASYGTSRTGARALRATSMASLLDVGQHPSPSLIAPQPLPRGRHRLPGAVVKRVQRERILHATAQVIRTKGYPNTTVADVVAAAGVSREVFYSHFHNRSEAFMETHQLVFENMMAATAGAFFASAGPWPEQVWQSARASTRFVLEAPSFAYFAFVESYALGAAIARRTDDAVLAFTALLTSGYSQRPEGAALPHSYSDAIVGAIMEAVAYQVRVDRPETLADLLPVLTYLILAPFLGADATSLFLEGKLRGAG